MKRTVPFVGKAEQINVNQYAFNLLSLRDYTEKALRRKLSQRFPDNKEMHDPCIEKCKHYNYINDSEFAKRFIKSLLAKNDGPMKIKQSMMRKGFSANDIQEAMSSTSDACDKEKLFDAALSWREKWFDQDPIDDPKVKRRLMGRLANKGFSFDTVNKVINHRFEE